MKREQQFVALRWMCHVLGGTGLVLVCTSLIVGCGGTSSPPTASMPLPTPSPVPGTPGPAVTVIMPKGASDLTTTAYVPNPVSVSAGTTVTWTNNDDVPHTSTSTTGVFDSGNVPAGGSYSLKFQSAGSFSYYCIYHPRMVGTIIVQ